MSKAEERYEIEAKDEGGTYHDVEQDDEHAVDPKMWNYSYARSNHVSHHWR